MGLVNQLGKFSLALAEISQPLRELLRMWTWGSAHEECFTVIKAELTKPTVLSHHDAHAATKVSADIS
jgi:hypothetical protein